MMNAMLIGNAGQQNVFQQALVTKMNLTDVKHVATFNMGLQKQVTEYNTALLLDELPRLMTERDLSLTHIRQQAGRQQGSIVAYQAASGTTIGTGSNLDVVVDNKTQQALDEQVVSLQYQWNVDAIYDAIAKNEWEGQMAIDKMAFEAGNQIRNMKSQAAIKAYATLTNSTTAMFSELNNTMHKAESIMWQGTAQAATYQSAADAAWTTGVIKAGGSLISGALKYGTFNSLPGKTKEFMKFDKPIMEAAATGSDTEFFEAVYNYKPPNAMASWTPGSSLLSE